MGGTTSGSGNDAVVVQCLSVAVLDCQMIIALMPYVTVAVIVGLLLVLWHEWDSL